MVALPRTSIRIARRQERPPIIVEYNYYGLIRVGYVQEHQPKHLIEFQIPSPTPNTPQEWYHALQPLIQTCLDRLFVTSPRRIIVLSPPYMPRAWVEAMKRVCWDRQVPAIAFWSVLDTPPLALEWKRGLLIYADKNQYFCMAHADGHGLSFTLQIATTREELILALAKCLEACPGDVRQDVASNVVVCGNIIDSSTARLPKEWIELLDNSHGPQVAQADDESSPLKTSYPVNYQMLKPIRLQLCTTGPYRADFVAWIGASLMATVLYRHGEVHEGDWILPPGTEE